VKPIVFLDVDGVLNTLTHIHEWGIHMHPDFVQRLRQICVEYDAEIVLSSSWRIGADHYRCTKFMLRHLGIDERRLIDRTPAMNGVRGDEIQQWLADNGERPYVIVDDSDDMLDEQLPRFVHTSPYQGLTEAKARDVCQVLEDQGVKRQRVTEPAINYFERNEHD